MYIQGYPCLIWPCQRLYSTLLNPARLTPLSRPDMPTGMESCCQIRERARQIGELYRPLDREYLGSTQSRKPFAILAIERVAPPVPILRISRSRSPKSLNVLSTCSPTIMQATDSSLASQPPLDVAKDFLRTGSDDTDSASSTARASLEGDDLSPEQLRLKLRRRHLLRVWSMSTVTVSIPAFLGGCLG